MPPPPMLLVQSKGGNPAEPEFVPELALSDADVPVVLLPAEDPLLPEVFY